MLLLSKLHQSCTLNLLHTVILKLLLHHFWSLAVLQEHHSDRIFSVGQKECWLIINGNLLLTVLEAESPRSRCQQIWFLVKAAWQIATFSLCLSSHGREGALVSLPPPTRALIPSQRLHPTLDPT